jgi:hypothetical protein
MEYPDAETKLCSMETLSHSKVLWVLAALCAVPVCRAATEGSTNPYESRRVEPIAHPTGSTQKFLSAIGSSNFENAAGRFNEHSYEASATKPAAFVSVPESTRDAVRAELDNLSWQTRAKTLEEAGKRFHQEGIPLTHLWQSSSSSLSLGINPDRKPGIWFVKRFP